MRQFLKIENGVPSQWPISATAVSRLAPVNTSFPRDCTDADLTEFGFETLVETAQPAFDPDTQTVREVTPIEIDDVWTQQWEVVELTADEIAAKATAAAEARIVKFTPPQIIAALEAMGVAGVILANTDDLTKAKFYTASSVREDDERLLAALGAVGKTIDELKAAVV